MDTKMLRRGLKAVQGPVICAPEPKSRTLGEKKRRVIESLCVRVVSKNQLKAYLRFIMAVLAPLRLEEKVQSTRKTNVRDFETEALTDVNAYHEHHGNYNSNPFFQVE
jgi:hypothetical protein